MKPIDRREFLAGAGATVAALSASAQTPAEAPMPELKSQFLFHMEAELEPPQNAGARQIYIVKGGKVEGPRVSGTILPGGGDWAKARPDGTLELDVRGSMKTPEGEIIYTNYRGIIRQKEGGQPYFRTTPYFETASKKYDWLNHIVAVGVGSSDGVKVTYDVFEIL